jgi:hypothetical protein
MSRVLPTAGRITPIDVPATLAIPFFDFEHIRSEFLSLHFALDTFA